MGEFGIFINMKITKSKLKDIIKECVNEVLVENSQPQSFDFDAEWKRLDEAGVPVIHLTNEEYNNSFMNIINEGKPYNLADNIIKTVRKG